MNGLEETARLSTYDRESMTSGRTKISAWHSKYPNGSIFITLEGHSLAETGELLRLTSTNKERYDYLYQVSFSFFIQFGMWNL